MTVYLDLVMGLNFAVDLLLLTLANRLAGYPAGWRKALPAAALGGVYGGACLVPGFHFLGNILWRTVSLGAMSVLAFGIGSGTLRRGVLFALLSMALGGIVLAMGSGGIGALLAGAIGMCAMCGLGWGNRTLEHRYATVELSYGVQTVTLTALHDTGNTLRDPVTGERVLVTGPWVAKDLLGLERGALLDPTGTILDSLIPGLRLIPYRAVGKAQGMLLGIRVSEAKINGRPGAVVVAFAPEGLEHGEFNALIGGSV